MTHIVNARVTFHSTPVHMLERFMIKDQTDAYRRFQESGLEECVIVQTCNRVELYGKALRADYAGIIDTWADITGLDRREFEGMETGEDGEAIQHLLKLVSGLDSMVVGEEQVLGQVKESIASARNAGASGLHLNTLFDRATRVGTRIRNSTEIGRGGISVGSMAVKLVEENIDDLKSKRLLVIGTGEVSTLVAKSLSRRGYVFAVASRTLRRAAAFCETMGGTPVRFEDVLVGFGQYDVIFVATTAPFFLVAYDAVSAMPRKKDGMMILDLSNPRAVDERISTIPGIKMMNLDQIGEMIERNMKEKASKASAIEGIIDEEVPALEASMHRLEAEPLVKGVFMNMDRIRERELAKALQMLGETDPKKVRVITDMSRAILESIASTPMNNIRQASEHGEKGVLETAGRLFDYGTRQAEAPKGTGEGSA